MITVLKNGEVQEIPGAKIEKYFNFDYTNAKVGLMRALFSFDAYNNNPNAMTLFQTIPGISYPMNILYNGQLRAYAEDGTTVGYAYLSRTYSGTDTARGTINRSETESSIINNICRTKIVVDFPTHACNGSIKTLKIRNNTPESILDYAPTSNFTGIEEIIYMNQKLYTGASSDIILIALDDEYKPTLINKYEYSGTNRYRTIIKDSIEYTFVNDFETATYATFHYLDGKLQVIWNNASDDKVSFKRGDIILNDNDKTATITNQTSFTISSGITNTRHYTKGVYHIGDEYFLVFSYSTGNRNLYSVVKTTDWVSFTSVGNNLRASVESIGKATEQTMMTGPAVGNRCCITSSANVSTGVASVLEINSSSAKEIVGYSSNCATTTNYVNDIPFAIGESGCFRIRNDLYLGTKETRYGNSTYTVYYPISIRKMKTTPTSGDFLVITFDEPIEKTSEQTIKFVIDLEITI